MNALMLFLDSWLLGGLTYPVLTFLITAAMKSSAIVLLAWSVTAFLWQKPALMRLWAWRACVVALLCILLWGLAPRWMESWRLNVELIPRPQMAKTVEQAQSAELLSKGKPREQPPIAASAPLLAYTDAEASAVPLASMRMPRVERIEQRVFHVWWSVAVLLLAWRVFRSVCGHFWLRRQSEGVLSGTEYRLVRGLTSPVVTGWRKAQIWLPVEAAQWPEAKLRAVCLHEMAHHARHDGAWQWLGWLAAAVWWWNPLAWLALRHLTAEAELSADESALSQHISATDYAQVLVEIAAGGDLSTPAAGVAMLGRCGVKSRVKSLLRGTGKNGVFGSKTRFVFVLSAVAAVMAAGMEVRHVFQVEKPLNPLTEGEKALVERALTILDSQIEKLARVHVKLTEAWSVEGKENKSSPRPSVIEAWVDETARHSRAEYRPRVGLWMNGAAPWYVKDETVATDSTLGWHYEGAKSDEVEFTKVRDYDFFSWWEDQSGARELRTFLQMMKESGCKTFAMADHLIFEGGDHLRIERRMSQSSEVRLWEIDLKKRGLALYRQQFPRRPEPFSSEWSVQAWATLNDGTPYPAHSDWKHHSSEGLDTYTRQITSLEVITGIPPALLAPPQKQASPFIATDGVARHGEWLETRFVHAETGKPVPEVKVHFEINGGKRMELVSDAGGVLRIPLPKGEVQSLRYWGMKPGFVMQRVTWRRYGDPLKLPEMYETKLYPAGKPIGGTIVDSSSKPVAGAQIEITHTGGATRWDVFADVHDHGNGSVRTNAEGKWSMRGFAEDLSGLIIRVEHPQYQRVAIGYEMATGQPLESLRDGTGRVVLK